MPLITKLILITHAVQYILIQIKDLFHLGLRTD